MTNVRLLVSCIGLCMVYSGPWTSSNTNLVEKDATLLMSEGAIYILHSYTDVGKPLWDSESRHGLAEVLARHINFTFSNVTCIWISLSCFEKDFSPLLLSIYRSVPGTFSLVHEVVTKDSFKVGMQWKPCPRACLLVPATICCHLRQVVK